MVTNVKREIQLGRREKRLRFWREKLGNPEVPLNETRDVEELLQTFALLIAKLANASAEAEAVEADSRLGDLERQLTSRFEAYRLYRPQ